MAEAAPARALDDLNPAFKASEDHLEKQAIAPVSNRPAHYVEIDPKAEAKLRLKLDLCLIPIVTLVNLLSFIDRANIGNARVAGGFLTSMYVPWTYRAEHVYAYI